MNVEWATIILETCRGSKAETPLGIIDYDADITAPGYWRLASI
jgi:hypothetical protein